MLELSGVCKSYGSLQAVADLSLHVERGEVFGLLGPNGAGKTTTISMVVGLLRPDSGELSVAGAADPTIASVRAKIGLAPQQLAIYDTLTGRENLDFFGRLHGLRGKRLRERVDWALSYAGLTDRAGDRAEAYSGGMQRRLNLAAAVLHEPALLLLDEPTVGVDPQSRASILDGISEMADSDRAIVYTSHYMDEVQRICDRVAIVDHGKLLAIGTCDALIDQHGGSSVVVAETAKGEERIETDDPLKALSRFQEAGGLLRFRVDRPDLESVFLNLTGRALRD